MKLGKSTHRLTERRTDQSSSSDEDQQVREYVIEFRREIEEKFRISRMNQAYCFPRNPKNKSHSHRRIDSIDSLRGVTFYDLESQNVKRKLNCAAAYRKNSASEKIVEIIKSLGRLDGRYLQSQFSSPRSPFFKLLHKSMSEKLEQWSARSEERRPATELRPNSNRTTLKAEKKGAVAEGEPASGAACRRPPPSYRSEWKTRSTRPANTSASPHSNDVSCASRLPVAVHHITSVYPTTRSITHVKTLKASSMVAVVRHTTAQSQTSTQPDEKITTAKTPSCVMSKRQKATTGRQDKTPRADHYPVFLRTVLKDPKKRKENFSKFLSRAGEKL